jgi:hypothetical protein
MRAKAAEFATLKKVKSFVFSYFLASFPLYLYFLAILRVSPRGSISVLDAFRCDLPAARTPVALEGSLLGSDMHAGGSKLVRFGFVLASFFDGLPVFSITYWLRSLFFCVLESLFLPWSAGLARLSFLPTRTRRSNATKGPQFDNRNRLP